MEEGQGKGARERQQGEGDRTKKSARGLSVLSRARGRGSVSAKDTCRLLASPWPKQHLGSQANQACLLRTHGAPLRRLQCNCQQEQSVWSH